MAGTCISKFIPKCKLLLELVHHCSTLYSLILRQSNLNNNYIQNISTVDWYWKCTNCVRMFSFCLLNFMFFHGLIQDLFSDFARSWFNVSSPLELFPLWFPIRISPIRCSLSDRFSLGIFWFETLFTLILPSYGFDGLYSTWLS